MDLIFTNPEHTSIKVTLAADETLGNFQGATECFVPVAPGNKEYDSIIEQGLTIAAYVPPA